MRHVGNSSHPLSANYHSPTTTDTGSTHMLRNRHSALSLLLLPVRRKDFLQLFCWNCHLPCWHKHVRARGGWLRAGGRSIRTTKKQFIARRVSPPVLDLGLLSRWAWVLSPRFQSTHPCTPFGQVFHVSPAPAADSPSPSGSRVWRPVARDGRPGTPSRGCEETSRRTTQSRQHTMGGHILGWINGSDEMTGSSDVHNPPALAVAVTRSHETL